MLRDCIESILEQKNISLVQAKAIMDQIASGALSPEEIAMFLTAMRMKQESADEIAGVVMSAKEHAISLPLLAKYDTLCDIVGTGGDGSNTINISTLSGFIAAGAGAKVAKHGNRAVSSKCGSADVLEALDVNIQASKETVAHMIDKAGMGFMFAPLYHPAMKYVAPVRKALKIRTLFNILGPLINPASVPNILLGVYSREKMELMAHALLRLHTVHAMVVWSHDNTDEISVSADTEIMEVKNLEIKRYTIQPKEYGFHYQKESDIQKVQQEIQGGSATDNAQKIVQVLQQKSTGVVRDIGIMNAAALLYVSGLCSSIEEGIDKASESIDSGKALQCLESMRMVSKSDMQSNAI